MTSYTECVARYCGFKFWCTPQLEFWCISLEPFIFLLPDLIDFACIRIRIFHYNSENSKEISSNKNDRIKKENILFFVLFFQLLQIGFYQLHYYTKCLKPVNLICTKHNLTRQHEPFISILCILTIWYRNNQYYKNDINK